MRSNKILNKFMANNQRHLPLHSHKKQCLKEG
jgi:hypothetical protein